MTLKPRKTRHRNRVGWASIKTHRGWGLHSVNSNSVLGLFGKKLFVLGLVALIVIPGAAALSTGPLFHSYVRGASCTDQEAHEKLIHGVNQPCLTDPSTYLWKTDGTALGSGALSEFNTNGGSFVAGLGGCSPFCGMAEQGNATFSAVALTKNPVDLSTISAKQMWSLFTWSTTSFMCCGNNIPWGMFLTTNGTVANGAGPYNPESDKSVALVLRFSSTGGGAGGVFNMELFLQRNIQTTILSQDDGSCHASGSCFLFQTYTFNPVQPAKVEPEFFLNFTGATNGGTCANAQGSQCSSIEEASSTTFVSTQILPWLAFSGLKYYVGFWTQTNQFAVNWAFDQSTVPSACTLCMESILYVPTPTAIQAPPNIDTGGFFGPLIHAFIQLGVFIAANIINFFTYLASILWPFATAVIAQLGNGIKLALNAIGQFFGWGALGDNLFTFTNGVVSAVVQVLSAIASYLADIVSRVINFLSIVSSISGQIFGANGFLAAFFTLASNTFTQLVGIFAKFVLLGTPAITVYDFVLYFQLTGDAGFEGFGAWWGFNRWLAFAFINLTVMIINKAVTAITDLLSYIPTIAAHMPEDGLPALPTLQNIPFPGLRIPTGHVQKFREGDPAAVALWLFGGGLFMSLLALNVPGVNPLANIVAGSGCNPISCFSTAYNQVFLPFTLVFAVIISAVFITEMLHGVTMGGEQPRIVINVPRPKIPGELRGRAFRFGTKKFATLQKGSAKKAAKRREQISPEQKYENRYGGLPGE